jgi:hypothetical protein
MMAKNYKKCATKKGGNYNIREKHQVFLFDKELERVEMAREGKREFEV